MNRSKFSPEFKEKAKARAREIGVQEAARELNLQYQTLTHWLKLNGEVVRKGRWWTQERKDVVIKRVDAGKESVHDIARSEGIETSVLYRWIREKKASSSKPKDRIQLLCEKRDSLIQQLNDVVQQIKDLSTKEDSKEKEV